MDEVRLKKITDSIGLMQKNLECSICLDLLQDPVSTKCDHQFCNFCVLALLQSSSKPSARCPLCKVVITKRSLTKNEQLDQIVKAVRSVITAVEEDSGLRCSPPRGPVLISQPDPKPRELSPQKKVKGRISSKAKGQRRAGNVRKTKRKAAETVSVYRDDSESSDSDVFELPLVGHTNISSSFPRLKTSGKKGYHDSDQENEELEKEAEDLLAALSAAPLTSHGDIISGYSNGLEQRNNEINLRPINSGNPEEKENHAVESQARTSQNSTPLADSEIFEVPAPRVHGKVNISKQGEKESDKDPYEFVPSQRTPRKVKKKVGRKRNQSGKKEFPILKGRFAKPGAPRRDQKSASSCSESDQDGAMIQNKAKDKPLKNNASSTNLEQQNSEADSKTENASPKSGHVDDHVKETQSHLAQKDGSATAVTEENVFLDSADVVIEDTVDDGFDSKGNAQDMAPPVERNLIRHPLPITPVVVIKRGVGGNVQGSQQSSEGGMLTDSQPVVINRNHGRRVFATTYGKAKNGMDKSPPLDPQERILDWLVSKNAGSDESDYEEEGEDKEKEEAEQSEGFEDILIVQENGDAHPANLPTQEDKDVPNKDVSNNAPKLPTVADQPEPAEESEPRENRSEKEKLTPKKNGLNEKLEDQNGRRRSGRRNKESSQEKRTFDHTGGEVQTCDIQDSTMDRSQEKMEKEHPPRRRTAKQRMEDNLKEHTEAARKESEGAAIKSDWELALELARQFGTEPEHLKAEPDETSGRSSRRRKGKLTIETVPESKPVRKSKRHVQEHLEKENNEQDEVIDIDSYETQNLNKIPVKTIIKERKSAEAEKRKARTSNRRKRLGRQADIQTKDRNGEMQETDTPEAKVVRIPDTPYILDQAKGKTSLERESPPKKGMAEVESHEKDWEASKQRKAFHNTEVSSSKSAEHCTPNSLSSQSLTPSLRRSKRGCHPELPNGSSKVPEHVISDQMEQKKKEKITNKTEKNDKDPRNSGGNIKVLPDADDLVHHVDFSLQVIEGAETEAEEKIDIEETPLASLPLYTEDIPKDDEDFISPKKCRGSDTTESIDLKIDSDEYEDSDDAVEKEQELSSGGSPPKKVICSSPSEKDQDLLVDEKPSSGQSHDVSSFSSENQVKPSLDKEMSIMNRILPSVGSQECPALGISPGSRGNSSGTTSDLREEELVPICQKPDEIPQILSGSSITGKEPSQASVTILSQIKTSGSFPVSLDLNSQPSESLLKPIKQSKRKVSQDVQHGSTLHTQEGGSVKKPTTETPGAKQQVGSTKGSSVDNDVQEMPISSGSGNSRPARRISRRKRKTFTINACLSVPPSKDKATPPSQEIQQVPDTLEQPTVSLDNQMESELSKEAGQSDRCSYMSGHEETHETDGHNNTDDRKAAEDVEFVENVEAPSWSRALRKSSRSVRDRNSVDVTNEKLKSPLTASPVKRKKSKSLPTSDIQKDRKRGASSTDDSAFTNLPSASASQETLVSDMSRSSLKLKRKSRSSGRHSTQSPVPEMDVEESDRQPNPSDHMIGRLPDDELEGECKEAPKAAGGRRSSGRNKKSVKSETTASGGSAVPATPGASEIKEHSSNVVIPHRALKLHSNKNIDKGAEIPEKSELTPRSSPRIRSKNSVQRQNWTTASNKADEEENLEQRISTPPQECITIVDEGIGVSLAEKEESQESNKSLRSVEDIFSHHEESRDMFDEVEITENQEAMGIEESQSLNAEIVLLPEDLNAKDACGRGEIDDAESRAGCKRAKQDVQKKSTGIAKKLQHLSLPHEIDGRKDGTVLQGSSQFEDTEALIPPTPPCHNLSKSLASSFVHANGLSKPLPKRKQAQEKMAPDMSSLLGPSQDIFADKQNTVQAKSLVVETPTVVSRRRRNKVPHSQTEDRSIADTPVKPKQRSVGQKEKVGSSDHDAVTLQGKDQEDVFEHSEMSPEKSSESKACKSMTSQTTNNTPLELPIKSSNESDEVMRITVKRRKQVISDDDSDDEDEDDEIIGRQKRKAQRMVQVGRDEEDESDDELISCSFLQTSVQKEDNDDENPLETIGGKANSHLDHEADGGSVSSEDSCASHHMNLTSASSILSSQSEIMNTQQQEKTREDMQALEEQMAELQAALARERGGSRSNEDTNGEDEEEEEKEEEEEEDPQDLLVEEAEGAHTPDAKQNNSLRSNGRSPKRTKLRNKQVEISDEEDNDEMEEEDVAEPRSPSPPPPLSPSTVRKASSSLSMSDSIRSVTNMVEQYRKSSSKKVTTKKRRIEDELDDAFDDGDVGSDDDDDVAMVSSKSSRNSSRKGESSRRCSKKRRIERESLDSDEDETGDELKSPPKSRLDRKVDRYENVHHRRTPPCKTPLTLSGNRLSGSRKSPSSTSHAEGHHTPKIRVPQDHPARRARIPQDDDTSGIHTPRNHPTPRSTPNASSVPSPVDVSMKTQRTASQVPSPTQSRRRSGNHTLRSPEGGGPGPSPKPSSRPMSLIATGLNRVELRQVEQLTSRLANCRFASAFNANTTHVIVKTDSSLVCERTLKYFQGIAARAWIVSFQWVHDSLKARKLLAEADYEVKGDVVNGVDHHGPKRARTHEGPGFMAKFDLCCIGPFTGLNKDQLVGLCEMCGASTVQHPSLFPYNPGRKAFIIVEPNIDTDRDYQGLHRKFRVPVISREWVLDSIALYKSQPIADYLLSDLTSPMRDQPIIDLDSDDE